MADNSKLIAGVDVGNSTTEVILAEKQENGKINYLAHAMVSTTGLKGTAENTTGIIQAMDKALEQTGKKIEQIEQIRLNDAVPVIGDASMDTISETTIIGSAMIGHNPDTPGGSGLGTGMTINIENLSNADQNKHYIAVIGKQYGYANAAEMINQAVQTGITVNGAIVQMDDGVLIHNRLTNKIPIVDEVLDIKKVKEGVKAAVEVAENGSIIQVLSNPYGIAQLFDLDAEETRKVVPVARSLMGNRSGVALRAENARVDIRTIPAGRIMIEGSNGNFEVEVSSGAEKIMDAVKNAGDIIDIKGSDKSNTEILFSNMKEKLAKVTESRKEQLRIQDLFASDSMAPIEVSGGLAGEKALENVVLVAAMVKAGALPIKRLSQKLSDETNVFVRVGGKEANMALEGALTTPGSNKPLAVLDMGGGSTDAALIDKDNTVKAVHMAGAGEMVTMMIKSELDIDDRDLAEMIKKYPLAKADSLLFLRFEDGGVKYLQEPLPPALFGRVLLVTEDKLIPLPRGKKWTMEKVALIRKESKKKVFGINALRALEKVAPEGNIRKIGWVIMVGGSALDFEIPTMIMDRLAQYRIVAGRANVLGALGPRGAVAYGLITQQ